MQSYTVVFKPGAELDIEEIFNWYELQRPSLGYEFILELDAAVSQIEKNALFAFNVTSEVRRAMIPRFPYNIYYTIEENIAFVHVIMHQFRDPEAWQTRINF